MLAEGPPNKCCVAGCRDVGQVVKVDLGTHCHFRRWCVFHAREFGRLRAAQGRDWGSSIRSGFDARLYYAGKKGFHAY